VNVLFVALFLECFMTCLWSVVTTLLAVLFTSDDIAILFNSCHSKLSMQVDTLFAILCHYKLDVYWK